MPALRFTRRDVLAASASLTVLGAGAAPAAARAAVSPGFSTTRLKLSSAGLDPSHEGLVVAHLTDIHIGPQTPMARVKAAIAACAGADLLVMTGDFVTYAKAPIALFAEAFGDRPPMPTFACLGNHDHIVNAAKVRTALEKLGVTVLQNEHTVAQLKGADLQVIGVDDGTTHHDDVAKAFSGTDAKHSRLVLTHSPPTADRLPRDEGLVCLTGHTHGGAIHLGGVTNTVFRWLGQPYVRGLYSVGGNHLYVNRGLGSKIRYRAEPELTLLTLNSAEAA